MSGASIKLSPESRAIAERFVHARLNGTSLPQFPGALPRDLEAAYAIQAAAISMWPDAVAGWKVAMLSPAWRDQLGAERLVGPIFRAAIRLAKSNVVVDFPVFKGGFAAVEAEFIFRLSSDCPRTKSVWTPDEAAAVVSDLHVGVETAGSPLSSINDLGPTAVVSDFGNNHGLILGPTIPDWRVHPLDSLPLETFIEGRSAGRGSSASVPSAPLAALAFALERCAKLGYPLRAGDLVSTGATTGIHQIRSGESARLSFGRWGEIHCRAVPAGKIGARSTASAKARSSC